VKPLISAQALHALHAGIDKHLNFSEDFLAKYKGLIFQIRSEGITISDRRVVKLLKLFAASALFDGRTEAADGDFFVLSTSGTTSTSRAPRGDRQPRSVDAYYRERPAERRFLGPQAASTTCSPSCASSASSHRRRRAVRHPALLAAQEPERDQAALAAIANDTARRMLGEVDQLLETVFASSKFGG
jgi:MoxR-like ATPase